MTQVATFTGTVKSFEGGPGSRIAGDESRSAVARNVDRAHAPFAISEAGDSRRGGNADRRGRRLVPERDPRRMRRAGDVEDLQPESGTGLGIGDSDHLHSLPAIGDVREVIASRHVIRVPRRVE